MLEKFFSVSWLKKRPATSVYLGVFFTLLSYLTSYLLFHSPSTQHFIGISTILFTVVLSIPTMNALYGYEEKLETKGKSFFRIHATVIDFFLYFFIGVFVTLFVLALFNPVAVFSEDKLFGYQSGLNQEVSKKINPRLPPPPVLERQNEVMSIFKNNMYVMMIAFVLSLFYGAGALFLIVLNASIFASALADVIRIKLPSAASFGYIYFFMSCNMGVIFFHMLPELSGYLLAAIAGGVLSTAMLKEKVGSNKFKRVGRDVVFLLLGSVALLYLAALIEVHISKFLYQTNVCMKNHVVVAFVFFLLILGVLILEFLRKRKK